MKKNDGTLSSFLAGAAAGAIDTCFTMPLDTVKTNLQINPRLGFIGCANQIVKVKGIYGFYSGFQPFVLQSSGKAAVRFYAYGVLSNLLSKAGFNREKYPTAFSITCGLGAGTCEAVLWTCPTERIKVLNQSSQGAGTISAVSVVRTQGLTGLYRGVVPTALRQASSVAVRFTLFEHIGAALKKSFGIEENRAKSSHIAAISFFSGGIGGAGKSDGEKAFIKHLFEVSVIVNNPIDVVKSKIQSGNGIKAMSMSYVVKQVYHESGIMGFYAGLSARIPRLFLSQAIQFTVVDQILHHVSAAK